MRSAPKRGTSFSPRSKKAAALEVTDGLRGTILVIDPASPTHEVLFTGHVGEQEDPFLENATGKAKATLRVGILRPRVRQDFPHLYVKGDIKYPGVILRDGLSAAAFSGVQGEFDEMISEWMVSAIRAICRDAMLRPGERQPGPYLGK